jgi:hypothetical protein
MHLTVAKICGERWPRRLPEGAAAAYCGMILSKFKKQPELQKLLYPSCGEMVADREDLDNWITKNKEEGKKNGKM